MIYLSFEERFHPYSERFTQARPYWPFHVLIHIYIHKILPLPLNTSWTPVFKPIGYSHFLWTAEIWTGPPDYDLWALQHSLHFFVLSLPLSNHGRGYAGSELACTSVAPLTDHNVPLDGAFLSIHLHWFSFSLKVVLAHKSKQQVSQKNMTQVNIYRG